MFRSPPGNLSPQKLKGPPPSLKAGQVKLFVGEIHQQPTTQVHDKPANFSFLDDCRAFMQVAKDGPGITHAFVQFQKILPGHPDEWNEVGQLQLLKNSYSKLQVESAPAKIRILAGG